MKNTERRFWSKVQIKGVNDCWEWIGASEKKEHGRFRLNRSTLVSAHRFSFELKNGEIPKGMCVCHACDNPACVNPGRLWLGTKADNNRDRKSKGRNAPTDGEKNPAAKLTEEDVREIRRLLPVVRSQEEIAKKFHVSIAQISNIKRGVSWSNI
jgi:hypothetical protein